MFIPKYYMDGGVDAWEYLAADDLTYHKGDALQFTSGHLIKCPATTKPTHISMAEKVIATDGDLLPVIAVNDETVYETKLSADSASIAVGTKYTLSATSDGVTATTTSGVAEVVSFEGKASGDTIVVKF